MQLCLSLFVLLVGLTLSSCSQPHLYHATAKIQVLPRPLTPNAPAIVKRPGPDNAQFQNEFALVFAPELLEPVIRDLKLDHIWAHRLNTGKDALSIDDALKHLNEVLKTEIVPSPPNEPFLLINITVTSEIPQEAADIANAIADHYKAEEDEIPARLHTEDVNAHQELLTKIKDSIAADQATVARYPDNPGALNKLRRDQGILQQIESGQPSTEKPESNVQILSRATPPPE
jgi:uncharacterized protein involved in exopolysaccharide biosynthesis